MKTLKMSQAEKIWNFLQDKDVVSNLQPSVLQLFIRAHTTNPNCTETRLNGGHPVLGGGVKFKRQRPVTDSVEAREGLSESWVLTCYDLTDERRDALADLNKGLLALNREIGHRA